MALLLPPTSQLPPVQKIASQPTKTLSDAITYLRHIYNPEVRGSRRHTPAIIANSEPLVSKFFEDSGGGLDKLRTDAFERSYAIRWLTALISQTEIWNSDVTSPLPLQERETLLQDAASLLAVCSGTAAAGIVIRDFIFVSDHGKGGTLKIHIKDVPLDNRNYGSVGAQTWGGACVLAEMIANDSARFGLLGGDKKVRILELGAGTGLVSLTAARVIEAAGVPSELAATIIATDYYPSVLENLESNIRSNFPFSSDITSHFLDWSLFSSELTQVPPFNEPFDLVLGADIIYEAQHATWIKACLAKLLRRPSGILDPMFHLMIPLRSTHISESSTVEVVFPALKHHKGSHNDLELSIINKETILCDAEYGFESDQVEYAYYKIGWC